MKLVDIKKAIKRMINAEFPNIKIFSPDVKEGFKKPSFYIQLLPISRERLSKYHFNRKVSVVIYYHSDKHEELELLDIEEKLEEIFSNVIRINDRTITIEDSESNIDNNVLHFEFDISYIGSLAEDKVHGYEEAELMQELILEKE